MAWLIRISIVVGILLSVVGCHSTTEAKPDPRTQVQIPANAGAAIVALENSDLVGFGVTGDYVEAVGITAGNRVDSSRRSPRAIEDSDSHSSLCYSGINICMLPDLAPGKYVLTGFGWSKKTGLLHAFGASPDASAAVSSPDAITFTVAAGKVTYVGAVSWSEDAQLFRDKGREVDDDEAKVSTFSYQRNPTLNEPMALRTILQSFAFRKKYTAWVPAIQQGISDLKTSSSGSTRVFKSDFDGYLSADDRKPRKPEDEIGLRPEKPEYGLAVIALQNDDEYISVLTLAPITADKRKDRDRLLSLAQRTKKTTNCYANISVCVMVDLAPGRYVVESIESNDESFSIGTNTHRLTRAGSDPLPPEAITFEVLPASTTYVGAYHWGKGVLPNNRLGAVPIPYPDTEFALLELLEVEDFRHTYAAWLPMIQKTLAQSSLSAPAARPSTAEQEKSRKKKPT